MFVFKSKSWSVKVTFISFWSTKSTTYFTLSISLSATTPFLLLMFSDDKEESSSPPAEAACFAHSDKWGLWSKHSSCCHMYNCTRSFIYTNVQEARCTNIQDTRCRNVQLFTTGGIINGHCSNCKSQNSFSVAICQTFCQQQLNKFYTMHGGE